MLEKSECGWTNGGFDDLIFLSPRLIIMYLQFWECLV